MNKQQPNQDIGVVSPHTAHYFVETNLGNGYIVPELPGIRVTFQIMHPGGIQETEISRQKLSMTAAEVMRIKSPPDTHTFTLDKKTGQLLVVPKPKTLPTT